MNNQTRVLRRQTSTMTTRCKQFFVPYISKRETTADERAGIVRVPGRITVLLTVNRELPQSIIHKYSTMCLSVQPDGHVYMLPSTSVIPTLLVDLAAVGVVDFRLSATQAINTLHCTPQGLVAYTYPNLTVQCSYCQRYVSTEELKRMALEYEYSADDTEPPDLMCPFCLTRNCVELIFERD